jgi:hypothetical protein
VYVVTTFDEGELVVIGVTAWARYLPTDFQYGDAKELRKHILLHTAAEIQEMEFFTSTPGTTQSLTKRRLRNLSLPQLKIALFGDTDFPEFEDVDDNKKLGDFLVLCTDPDSKQSGIGRLLLAFAINRMAKKYTSVLLNLGKSNGQVNATMQDMAVNSFGFAKIDTTFSSERFDVENLVFRSDHGEDDVFLLRETGDLKLTDVQTTLDLDRRVLGTLTCTRSNKTGFSSNGSKYVDARTDQRCGANKGYSNPYAGNYQ